MDFWHIWSYNCSQCTQGVPRPSLRVSGQKPLMSAHRARLRTNESFTVTTGPSSGHSESWYCPQSSHPAGRTVTCTYYATFFNKTRPPQKSLTVAMRIQLCTVTIMLHAYSYTCDVIVAYLQINSSGVCPAILTP